MNPAPWADGAELLGADGKGTWTYQDIAGSPRLASLLTNEANADGLTVLRNAAPALLRLATLAGRYVDGRWPAVASDMRIALAELAAAVLGP